ncbi:HypC/HybG/HupF family hydrogenase formation chaperone [uncultured Azonexus sp.]|uniref:HypC/HybG/HupF family hydrogenase formation chaperone n=1 Tax=uncultured Azonexus sp. TaxID=520307 RepID=UPI002611A0EA|nr:HypC/HybG/HupF family hydrogenase formation chaperone [uncultured Azonexus sp.]
MCLGIPVEVLACGEHFARCRGRDGEVSIDIRLVGAQPPGTWLLCFLDAAREVIPAERAAAVNAALSALSAVNAGETDLSAFFADLDREPQLPEFLRTSCP